MKLTQRAARPKIHGLRRSRLVCVLGAFCAVFSVFILLAPASKADEGMWLFNNPPVKVLQEKYHFQPTAAWLEILGSNREYRVRLVCIARRVGDD
jgi:hypothetical protein